MLKQELPVAQWVGRDYQTADVKLCTIFFGPFESLMINQVTGDRTALFGSDDAVRRQVEKIFEQAGVARPMREDEGLVKVTISFRPSDKDECWDAISTMMTRLYGKEGARAVMDHLQQQLNEELAKDPSQRKLTVSAKGDRA